MAHVCYEGDCASTPKQHAFSSVRGLRTHQYRCHQDDLEEQTSLGNARTLKRKRDAEEEEARKVQHLEAQLALEAASREPEPLPVGLTESLHGRLDLTFPTQIPLFERTIDAGLQRSGRSRRLPARFRDSLPTTAVPVHRDQRQQNQPSAMESEPPLDPWPQHTSEDSAGSKNHEHTITDANSFGVFREYVAVSSHNPRNPDTLMDVPIATAGPQPQLIGSGLTVVDSGFGQQHDPLSGSTNKSEDLLLAWMTTGPGSTPAGMNDLVHNVIRHPDFNQPDLENFNAITASRRFERQHFPTPGTTLKVGDGWKEGSVKIRVPCTKVQQKESEAPEFVVDHILYRDAVEVIESELKDPDAFENIHVAPYKEWWCPRPSDDPIRVYSEIYNSDVMFEADTKTRENLSAAEGDLETLIVAALLYSDSTHLASFGNASLWPIYLFLGNVSKYTRSKPTSFSAHHIAYIPTVR